MINGKQIAENYSDYIIDLFGDVLLQVNKPNSIQNADMNSFTWANSITFDLILNGSEKMPQGIVITTLNGVFKSGLPSNLCIINTKYPRLLYVKILNDVFTKANDSKNFSNAIISEKSQIGEDTEIGNFSIIHNDVRIGRNCFIGNNVVVKNGVKIGDNVIIQDNSVIGSEVMSYVRDLDNTFLRFPTFGNVIIENNVEIGSNVTIVSSSLGSTLIGFNTKINSNSYIGSGVSMGENNYIASGVNINGSCEIGSNNFIGSGTTIRNKIRIDSFITIGSGSNVINHIQDSDNTYVGNPAKKSPKIIRKNLF
jgi:UDP-3-O-[3-hydroxymyristoyl] glucosamine N-acyltransferase